MQTTAMTQDHRCYGPVQETVATYFLRIKGVAAEAESTTFLSSVIDIEKFYLMENDTN